jgi:hypothetical protein
LIAIAIRQYVARPRAIRPISLRSSPIFARSRRFASSRRRPCRILSAHSRAAFSPSARTDVRLALALLLIRITVSFLALGFCEIALVIPFAFVFRSTGLLKRDGNGLTPTFDLAGLSPWTTLQLAMFELMHDATHGLSLSGRWFGHGNLGCVARHLSANVITVGRFQNPISAGSLRGMWQFVRDRDMGASPTNRADAQSWSFGISVRCVEGAAGSAMACTFMLTGGGREAEVAERTKGTAEPRPFRARREGPAGSFRKPASRPHKYPA